MPVDEQKKKEEIQWIIRLLIIFLILEIALIAGTIYALKRIESYLIEYITEQYYFPS